MEEKSKIVYVVITVLLLCLCLMGFLFEKRIDTDDDGHPDDVDDFPNDSAFHKKYILADRENLTLRPCEGEFRYYFPAQLYEWEVYITPKDPFEIDEDIVYVEFQYSTNSTHENYNLSFKVMNYCLERCGHLHHDKDMYLSNKTADHQKTHVTPDFYGYWVFEFENPNDFPIYLDVQIFAVK